MLSGRVKGRTQTKEAHITSLLWLPFIPSVSFARLLLKVSVHEKVVKLEHLLVMHESGSEENERAFTKNYRISHVIVFKATGKVKFPELRHLSKE